MAEKHYDEWVCFKTRINAFATIRKYAGATLKTVASIRPLERW